MKDKDSGKSDPGESEISFVMTADDAERYAPEAQIDPSENLREKGRPGKKNASDRQSRE